MLTHKQDKFARLVAEGKDQSSAYREAYNSSKMKPETIHSRAYELVNNSEITARIQELKKTITEKLDLSSIITVEHQLKNAQKAVEETLKVGDWNNYLKAMEMQNRLLGLNAPVKQNINQTTRTVKDLIETLDNENN